MLEAVGLTVEAAGRSLLQDVSMTVRKGEVVALLGPNGAGKSTLLRRLSGERPPTRGEVWLQGRPLRSFRAAELARHRAVLPQHVTMGFSLPVIDVVLLGRHPHHRGVERAEDWEVAARKLDDVGLSSFAERPCSQLSGGEQLRVQVARVLAQLEGAQDGGLLLLDEPTASLDLPHAWSVLETARRAARSGSAVVVVLHDLNLAARFADRCVVLSSGRVVASGSPAAVLRADEIERVWRQPCAVLEHPEDGGPLIVPLRPKFHTFH